MADSTNVKGPTEGPSGYNGSTPPSSKDLSAPTKVYPGASKLPTTPSGKTVDGPGCEGMYSKK